MLPQVVTGQYSSTHSSNCFTILMCKGFQGLAPPPKRCSVVPLEEESTHRTPIPFSCSGFTATLTMTQADEALPRAASGQMKSSCVLTLMSWFACFPIRSFIFCLSSLGQIFPCFSLYFFSGSLWGFHMCFVKNGFFFCFQTYEWWDNLLRVQVGSTSLLSPFRTTLYSPLGLFPQDFEACHKNRPTKVVANCCHSFVVDTQWLPGQELQSTHSGVQGDIVLYHAAWPTALLKYLRN